MGGAACAKAKFKAKVKKNIFLEMNSFCRDNVLRISLLHQKKDFEEGGYKDLKEASRTRTLYTARAIDNRQ
jgi:hypothetical protein